MISLKRQRRSEFQLVEHLCFRLLPAQILLVLIGAVTGIVSSLFASNFVGAHAMSAVGLYSPIRMLVGAMGTMLLGGSQILIGKHMGRQQQEEMQHVFSLNLTISLLLSLGLTALLLAAVGLGLTGLFTEDALLRGYFDRYLLGVSLGLLPQILVQQLSGFLSLENQGRRTVVASIACIIATPLFHWLFLVVLPWQTFGLALASSLSMWVFLLVEALYYFSGRSQLKLRVERISWRRSREVFSTGLPGALTSGYMTVRGLVVNSLIMGCAGAAGLSAFATSNAFLDMFWAVPAGMCAVSRMLISISTGEEDRKTLQDIMRVVFFRFLPIVTGISVLIALFAVPCTRLYYRDMSEPVFQMMVNGLRILPLCMPLSTVCMHFVCYGQASGKQLLIHLLSLIDGVGGVLLFSLALTPALGLNGIYAANVLNGVLTTLVILLYAWIQNRRFPRNMQQLMVIPPQFGVAESDRIDMTVRSMQEVLSISRRAQSFCLEKGIDRRRAYFAALAVEEMAGNAVAHGFGLDRKPHSVELRISCKGDELILRIKDDCRPFDPSRHRALPDREDPARNIGIRLVLGICREFKYQNILGINAVTIRL